MRRRAPTQNGLSRDIARAPTCFFRNATICTGHPLASLGRGSFLSGHLSIGPASLAVSRHQHMRSHPYTPRPPWTAAMWLRAPVQALVLSCPCPLVRPYMEAHAGLPTSRTTLGRRLSDQGAAALSGESRGFTGSRHTSYR